MSGELDVDRIGVLVHEVRSPVAALSAIAETIGEGEVDLGPGASTSVTLVPAAGRYKVHCGHPFHAMMGMKGDIIVR